MRFDPRVVSLLATALAAACGSGGEGTAGADAQAAVRVGASVSASASAPSGLVAAGSQATLVMTVSNRGTATARNVSLRPELASQLSRLAVRCTASGSVSCPSVDGELFTVARLPAHASLRFELDVAVAPGASGALSSLATVKADNDINPADNTAPAVINAYSADVQVTGVAPTAPVAAGGPLNYQMTVSNAGPDDAHDLLLTNTLGPNQLPGSLQCSASGGASCPDTSQQPMKVAWLPKQGSLAFNVSATVLPGTSGSIENNLKVSLAGDPLEANNIATAQATAFVDTVPTKTLITLQSDLGDYVGGGKAYSYSRENAVVSVSANSGHLRLTVAGDQNWGADFQLPSTQTQLAVGSYPNLTRYPFHDPKVGGLDWSGEGRGCNTIKGSLTINEARYSGSQLSALDMDFEQHCEGAAPALRGHVAWAASDTTVPPGPLTPPPAGLWMPAAGSTPATGSYMYLTSDAGDYIGGGKTTTYTPANAVLSVTGNAALASVSVQGFETWSGNFQGMTGLSQLQAGYYGKLQRYPFHNPTRGGLDWSGEGRGCNKLDGWFVVDDVRYDNGVLSMLDLRFEQHCEGMTPALHGKLHWNANDSVPAPTPVDPPPANLWKPVAGATPATGNYIYLSSENGDYIGAGRSYLYTPTTASLGVSASGGLLRMDASTSSDWWSGSFQTMKSLTRLQPGYYANLTRYPFHNPMFGGFDWSGSGRGCNKSGSWVVVDKVSYVGDQLNAIDLRFEQHCDGATPALHGAVHWQN